MAAGTASPHVAEYAARLVLSTHPDHADSPELVKRFVRYGASPRAMQGLMLASRAVALLEGRPWVSEADIRTVVHPVMRHRMILIFEAELEGVGAEKILGAVLRAVPSQKPKHTS